MRYGHRIIAAFFVAALMGTHATAQAQEAAAPSGKEQKFVSQKDGLTRPADPPWFLPYEIGVRLLAGRFSGFTSIDGIEQEARASYYPDLVLRFRIGREHALQTGVAYVQKGATLNGDANIGTGDYITIPLLYRISPRSWALSQWIQPYATAGGYLGFLVGGNFKELADDVSQYDVGFSAGLGANIHVHPAWILDIGVQYSQGFFSVHDDLERTNRTTLFGVAATWDLGGDDDADGLLNRKEDGACWTRAEDWDEWAGKDGCPDLDNDSDGLSDNIDPCPDEPEDKDGFRDWDGCPDPDNDFDMVLDAVDECQGEPFWGPLDPPSSDEIRKIAEDQRGNNGCFPKYETFDIIPGRDDLTLRAGYVLNNFARRSSAFNDSNHVQARRGLDEIASFLKAFPFVKLHVKGHKEPTEKAGVDTARAMTVMNYLHEKGVAMSQLVNAPPGACTGCPTIRPVKAPGSKPKKSERLQTLEGMGDRVFGVPRLYNEYRREQDEYERRLKRWEARRRTYQRYQAASAIAQACAQQAGPGNDRRVTFEID